MSQTREFSTGSLICSLALRIKTGLNNAFQQSGVTITTDQWVVLKCLSQEDGISQSELADRVDKDKASITRILDIMQKNGLIKRCDDESDRRSYCIYLTEAGERTEKKLKSVVQTTGQEIFRNLDSEEMKELRRLLLKVADGDG